MIGRTPFFCAAPSCHDEADELADTDEAGQPAPGDETDDLTDVGSEDASNAAGQSDGLERDLDAGTIDLIRSLAGIPHAELWARIREWHTGRMEELTLSYTLHYQEVQRGGWAAADRTFEEGGYQTRGRRATVDRARRSVLPPILQRIAEEQQRAIEAQVDLYEDIPTASGAVFGLAGEG
ncbi:hypothetical protein FRC08_013635 [Ceratobasidium sp. 394]|nr:hypothetical protein FRC08_013635 [Ceratobasidium sp. 394]